jgi:hypothetical protein
MRLRSLLESSAVRREVFVDWGMTAGCRARQAPAQA